MYSAVAKRVNHDINTDDRHTLYYLNNTWSNIQFLSRYVFRLFLPLEEILPVIVNNTFWKYVGVRR